MTRCHTTWEHKQVLEVLWVLFGYLERNSLENRYRLGKIDAWWLVDVSRQMYEVVEWVRIVFER